MLNVPMSLIGKMLRDSNIDGYLYTNMACVSPRKYKSRASMIGFGWIYIILHIRFINKLIALIEILLIFVLKDPYKS